MILVSLALLSGVLVPIKLAPAYVAVILTLVLGWFQLRKELITDIQNQTELSIPMLGFTLAALFAACMGLDPQHSIGPTIKMLFLFSFIFLIAHLRRDKLWGLPLVLAIALGQSITSLHTIGESAYPEVILPFSHGQVTEAGQLSLAIFVTLGGILYLWNTQEKQLSLGIMNTTSSICGSICLLLLGFSAPLSLSNMSIYILTAASFIFVITGFIRISRALSRGDRERSALLFLATIALPVLSSALLLNLKRGPWLGVTAGLIMLGIRLRPKLLLWGTPPLLLTALGITPIRERIFASSQHFYIQGGRSDLWELGFELTKRFPLGIGFDNSQILNNFTHNIPTYLDHFHSNFINITVELGWLGLVSYCWIFGMFLLKGLLIEAQSSNGRLTLCLACGVLAWQVAGFVEYNFGDSEVLLLALMTLGLLAGGARQSRIRT